MQKTKTMDKLEVKLELLGVDGVPTKMDSFTFELKEKDPNRADRLVIHIGECLYKVDRNGYIIERIVPHENT